MISGFEATTSVIISIWVIIGFLLLRAGSLRYWTAAFVALLAVVGFGDHLSMRALLVGLLAMHVLFVVPAAAGSGQRVLVWMALVSLGLLAGLVVTGGVRYWLPALIVAVVVVPLGVPLLWASPRAGGVEMRFWPGRRGPRLPQQTGPTAADPVSSGLTTPSADAADADPATDNPAPPDETDESPEGEESSPRNVRQFPPGRRPGTRPAAQNRPQRQRRPPAAS
jgi:hypothetical protein